MSSSDDDSDISGRPATLFVAELSATWSRSQRKGLAAFSAFVGSEATVRSLCLCEVDLVDALRLFGDHVYRTNKGKRRHHLDHAIAALKRITSFQLRAATQLSVTWEKVVGTRHRTPVLSSLLLALASFCLSLRRPDVCVVFLLMFGGALRPTEARKLSVSCLVYDGSFECIYVKLFTTKSGSMQHSRVTDALLVHVINLLLPYVPKRGKICSFSDYDLRKCFQSFQVDCIGMRIASFTLGGMRSGAAVSAYRHGVHISSISWILRHKSLTTIEHYLQSVICAILPLPRGVARQVDLFDSSLELVLFSFLRSAVKSRSSRTLGAHEVASLQDFNTCGGWWVPTYRAI
jgi:hypothetical protein